MTRMLSVAAFALGVVVVVWMASSFVAGSALALAVTLLIAVGYCVGFVELWRYQQASQSLLRALASLPGAVEDLTGWLAQLHPSLRVAVRQRIRGEHLGLPAPVMTPYLVGLLVMLGLLGTFIGMVATLQGAVTALEGSSELSAVRAGLAAPIQGLGMAFATSVAGVTASAMLGLISTLSRRERLQASRQLDAEMSGAFSGLSLGQQRLQTYQALQQQAEALPGVAERLDQLSQRLAASAEQNAEALLAGQREWQAGIEQRFRDLASSVDHSLNASLGAGMQRAGDMLQPMLNDYLQGQVREVAQLRQDLSEQLTEQLSSLTGQLKTSLAGLGEAWQQGVAESRERNAELLAKWQQGFADLERQAALRQQEAATEFTHLGEQWLANQQALAARQQQSLQEAAAAQREREQQNSAAVNQHIAELIARSDALLEARESGEAHWQAAQETRFTTLLDAVDARLNHLAELEQDRGDRAVAQLEQLQTVAAERLAALGVSLEQPMRELIATASETPKAAAEVIAKLRGEISNSIERDNALLEERQQLLAQLNSLTETLEANSRRQAEAINTLLEEGRQHMATTVDVLSLSVSNGAEKLQAEVEHFSAGADELASLGVAFTAAVTEFGQTNQALGQRLTDIERALAESGERNREQMEYYLLQAREIIDHNLLVHQELLQQIQGLSKAERG